MANRQGDVDLRFAPVRTLACLVWLGGLGTADWRVKGTADWEGMGIADWGGMGTAIGELWECSLGRYENC